MILTTKNLTCKSFDIYIVHTDAFLKNSPICKIIYSVTVYCGETVLYCVVKGSETACMLRYTGL